MKRLILVLVMMLSLTMSGAAVNVKLASQAEVTGALITLGDVATVSDGCDELIDLIGKVRIGETGESATTTVKMNQVRRALFAAGFNLAEIEVAGSASVEVRRVNALPNRKAEVKCTKRIADEIRRFVAAQKGIDETGVDVEVIEGDSTALPETVEVRLVCLGGLVDDGEMSFEVRPRRGDEKLTPFRVKAAIRRMTTVVVAKRTLVAGSEIGEGDVTVKAFAGAAVPPGAVKDVKDVLGARLCRRINSGGAIQQADIARTLQVRRGELCTVVVRGNGYHIVTKAVARRNGAVGDEVELEKRTTRERAVASVDGRPRMRRYTTRERLVGVVTGHRRVEIRVGGEDE